MYSIQHPTYRPQHFSIPELVMDLERKNIGLDWEITWNDELTGRKASLYPQNTK